MFDYFNSKINELKDIPPSIWALSTATLLISISSIMAFSIGPFFMTKVLGLSLLSMGAIEGFTECIAQVTRLFAGVSGDYLKRNKPLLLIGFVLATLSKPFFIFANGVSMVMTSKILERLSNGMMAIPRDAFVASAARPGNRGQSLGLVMSMKTLGCMVGSWVIALLLNVTNNYTALLWVGFVVCFFAIFVLVRYVHEEPQAPAQQASEVQRFQWTQLQTLGRSYWSLIIVASIFTAARVNDGFLLLRFEQLGGSPAVCASLIGIFNCVSAFCCYPIGRLSDKVSHAKLLTFSFGALILSYACFAYASGTGVAMLGVLLWGLQRGTSQVLLTAMIASVVPRNVLGTALGILYLVLGVMAFAASVIAGQLADQSMAYAFEYGLAVSMVAMLALGIRTRWAGAPRAIVQPAALQDTAEAHTHQDAA